MTPSEILDLEVSLLLLKHGKHSLLRSLARRLNVTEGELASELERLRSSDFLLAKKKSAGRPFVLDAFLVGKDDKADVLRQLHSRFENRTFLPELKDVKRLFDRHGRQPISWKSRALAKATVFRFLAELPDAELRRFLAEPPATKDVSALGLISDEILGRNKPSR